MVTSSTLNIGAAHLLFEDEGDFTATGSTLNLDGGAAACTRLEFDKDATWNVVSTSVVVNSLDVDLNSDCRVFMNSGSTVTKTSGLGRIHVLSGSRVVIEDSSINTNDVTIWDIPSPGGTIEFRGDITPASTEYINANCPVFSGSTTTLRATNGVTLTVSGVGCITIGKGAVAATS